MIKKIKVILTNKHTDNNKKLLKFFELNLNTLNSNGLFFNWIIAYPEEKELYLEQGIKEFPLLIPNGENNTSNYIKGPNTIMNYIKKLLESLQNKNIPKNFEENGEFDINSYFINQMQNEEDEDDMDESARFSNTLTNRLAQMQKARDNVGQHSSSMSNPEIHERNAQIASRNSTFNFNKSPSNITNSKQQNIRSNNLEPPSAVEILQHNKSKKGGGSDADLDNDLLEKFYSNMETTVI